MKGVKQAWGEKVAMNTKKEGGTPQTNIHSTKSQKENGNRIRNGGCVVQCSSHLLTPLRNVCIHADVPPFHGVFLAINEVSDQLTNSLNRVVSVHISDPSLWVDDWVPWNGQGSSGIVYKRP